MLAEAVFDAINNAATNVGLIKSFVVANKDALKRVRDMAQSVSERANPQVCCDPHTIRMLNRKVDAAAVGFASFAVACHHLHGSLQHRVLGIAVF